MTKKALIYARQSFGSETESASIEVQLESCREWCRKNNVEVVGEYSDANVSSELYPDCVSGRAVNDKSISEVVEGAIMEAVRELEERR